MFKYLEFKQYLSTYLFTDTNVPPLPLAENLLKPVYWLLPCIEFS